MDACRARRGRRQGRSDRPHRGRRRAPRPSPAASRCRSRSSLRARRRSTAPRSASSCRAHTDLLACDLAFGEAGNLGHDGRPEIVIGVKGILYVELEARGPTYGPIVDAHSSAAPCGREPGLGAACARWRRCAIRPPAASRSTASTTRSSRGPSGDRRGPRRRSRQSAEAGLRPSYGVRRVHRRRDRHRPGAARYYEEPTCTIAGIHAGYGGPGLKTIIPATARGQARLPARPRSAAGGDPRAAPRASRCATASTTSRCGRSQPPWRRSAHRSTIRWSSASPRSRGRGTALEPVLVPINPGHADLRAVHSRRSVRRRCSAASGRPAATPMHRTSTSSSTRSSPRSASRRTCSGSSRRTNRPLGSGGSRWAPGGSPAALRRQFVRQPEPAQGLEVVVDPFDVGPGNGVDRRR